MFLAILRAADLVSGAKQVVMARANAETVKDRYETGSGPAPLDATMLPQKGWLLQISVDIRSSFIPFNHLLSKEWHDKCRHTLTKATSGGTRAAVVDDCSDMIEQPLVRTIAEVKNCVIRLMTLS